MDEASRVREFWFGKSLSGPLPAASELASRALALSERAAIWFPSSAQLAGPQDEIVRAEFGELVERAGRGELDGWADSPRRRLSLIILLDQFPRHLHRGSARAFQYDPHALSLALSGMQSAADGALNVIERIFFYMPLQHAEATEAQEESVAAYRRLLVEAPAEIRPTFAAALQAAEQHRELIRQFGRFPQRNRALGRTNTPEEDAYLKSTAGNLA